MVIIHLAKIAWDHALLIIHRSKMSFKRKNGFRPFRFEAILLHSNEYGKVVRQAWDDMGQDGVEYKVGYMFEKYGDLHLWNHNSFRNVNNQLKKRRKMLEDMQALIPSAENIQSTYRIEDEKYELLKREEMM